jgi:four helix bundle protein
MRNYKELLIWQKAMEIGVMTYRITKDLPLEEKFGLVSQLNRAAISISSNIAEGASRDSQRDFNRFLQIALGSAFEVESQLILTERIGLLSSEKIATLLTLLSEEQRMIAAYLRKMNPDAKN